MARQKEFDRNRVLDKAVEVFWGKGYEATSIQELVEHMGINRQSIYDTFGDKRALFLAALQHYQEVNGIAGIEILQSDGPVRQLIRQFFTLLVEDSISDPQRKGCFMVNTTVELASHDKEIATYTNNNLEGLVEIFYQLLLRGQAEGEVGSQHNPRSLAWFLVNNIQGLRVVAKSQVDASVLCGIVDNLLKTLD